MATVMIVDDDLEFARSMADIFEAEGHEVITADDGLEAIEKVKQRKPDLVLMDIKMPGMDGVTAHSNMKELYLDLQVILITAYPEVELISNALKEGAFGCFEKPLDKERLFRVVDDVLAGDAGILVIDDDEDFCHSVEDAFKESGHLVTVAHRQDTALQELHHSNFALILLDVKLGMTDGWKTYLAIREVRPSIPVLAITGYPDEVGQLAERIMERENRPWMRKPLDLPAIFTLLEGLRKEDGKKG